jgi:hypothetical protein
MAEKKAVGHAYNIDFLNVVFAASSIFLFLSTIWMVWDDFDREWKNTQRQFTQLELEVTRAQLAQTERGIDKAKMTGLQQQLAAAEKAMESNRQQVDELNGQLSGSTPGYAASTRRPSSQRPRRRPSSSSKPSGKNPTASRKRKRSKPGSVCASNLEVEGQAERKRWQIAKHVRSAAFRKRSINSRDPSARHRHISRAS